MIWCFIGAILDPRFKKKWIRLAGFDEHAVFTAVSEELSSWYRQKQSSAINSSCSNIPPTESVASPIKRRRTQLYSSVLGEPRPASVGSYKIVDEFETYINEPTSLMEEPLDPLDLTSKSVPVRPLKYWKQNASRFPLLSGYAREIFGVQASSGSIERDFSAATAILSAKRTRMKHHLFQKLVFINRNSRHLD